MKKQFLLLAILCICMLFSCSAGETSQQVTVTYSFSSETIEIGKPLTVSYEISGGSGNYTEIRWGMDEVTEHCCINETYQGGELTESKGSFTVIPQRGETIDVNVSCTDKDTGIVWCENYSNKIECVPNQNIPVSIDNVSSNLAVNEPFSFTYLIGGENEIDTAKVEIWTFARNDTYPDCVLEQDLDGKSGTVEITPRAGNQLYIAVMGKDKSGDPFYVKTDRLDVDTSNAFDDVTVSNTFSAENAQIGQPFTVSYEISGGSGEYEEISWGMDEVTEHCCINDNYQGGELTGAKGTFTLVPESGETIDVNVSCTDKLTKKSWCENYSQKITCLPSASINAEINNVPSVISQDEPFSFNYVITGTNNISEARAEVWVFTRNETYPDCLLQESITALEGTITYTPKAGNQLYIAVRGKDSDSKPFYVKTDRLHIGSSTGEAPIINGDADVNCYINMPGNGLLAQGGEVWQNSMVIDVSVENASYFTDNYPGTSPTWSIKQKKGNTLNLRTWTDSRNYRGELTSIPTQAGDSTFEITCNWGNKSTVKTITIHCVDFTWPTGLINIDDTVHTYVGASLSFNPQITPANWEVPGYPQLRWGFDDEADTFALTVPTKKDVSTDPYVDINDRKDLRIKAEGTYESTYVITSDRVSVGRLVTFIIDKEPKWTFTLPADLTAIEDNAFEEIAAEAVYIPDGCKSVGNSAFANSNISVIYVPDSVTEIGTDAFPSNVFIYTPANSSAAKWAADHDFKDYQIVITNQ